MVYDDEHLALWERGKGSTATISRRSKVTVFPRKPPSANRPLAQGRHCRFYGSRDPQVGAAYEGVWQRLVQPEKDCDPTRRDSPC